MRGVKALVVAAMVLAGVFFTSKANAQIYVGIGVQPVCQYGYYGYAPYGCAPVGYYGQGYFYNGIFLGVGPWGGWGYSHGWGDHRFEGARGGSYTGGAGWAAHQHYANGYRGGAAVRGASAGGNRGAATSRGGFSGGSAARGGGAAPRAAASHGGGGASHGGGGHGGGGGHH